MLNPFTDEKLRSEKANEASVSAWGRRQNRGQVGLKASRGTRELGPNCGPAECPGEQKRGLWAGCEKSWMVVGRTTRGLLCEVRAGPSLGGAFPSRPGFLPGRWAGGSEQGLSRLVCAAWAL